MPDDNGVLNLIPILQLIDYKKLACYNKIFTIILDEKVKKLAFKVDDTNVTDPYKAENALAKILKLKYNHILVECLTHLDHLPQIIITASTALFTILPGPSS